MSNLKDKIYKRSLKLLYVEDDENVRIPTAKLLDRCSKELYIACDGVEGLELFKKYSPDVVVTDITMPRMDGLEMAEQIRKTSQFTPIIVTTAHFDAEFLMRAISIGINQYIAKPVDFSMLIDKLDVSSQLVLDLRQSLFTFQHYLKAISTSFAFSKTDANGVITYANDMFLDMYNYEYFDIIDQTHKVLEHPDNDPEAYDTFWKKITEDKKVWKGRAINVSSTGKEVVADVTIAPVIDLDGNVIEYIFLRDNKTELINKVRQLENKERDLLEQKLSAAKELEKAKESFLVVFTHELKTPLNSTINFSQFIEEDLKDHIKQSDSFPMLIEFAKQIRSNGEFMLNVVNSILDISKLKAGKLKFNITSFTPCYVIKNIVDRIHGAAKIESNIKTVLNLDENIVLKLDEFRFDHIVSNIYSNALKYGKDRIIIDLEINNQDMFVLSVNDNGTGVDKPEKVFELFEQCDDEHKERSSTGTGIGLHYVMLLCEGLGLNISVTRSEKIGGAKFIVSGKV